MSFLNKNNPAFTLIELLVVIAIIGILSSVVLASLSGAREEARRTTAQAQLDSIHTAIQMMLIDTGAGPGGCDGVSGGNVTVDLDSQEAGLVTQPAVGIVSGSTDCEWSSSEVSSWNGPYMNTNQLVDPWGDPYEFDSSWNLYQDGECPNFISSNIQGSIYSEAGTPGTSGNNMCDDIWIDASQ